MWKNQRRRICLRANSSQMSPFLAMLHNEFAEVLNLGQLELGKDPDFVKQCNAFADYLSRYKLLPLEKREKAFLGHINWKFRINAKHLTLFYKQGAKLGQIFNYHQKCAIQLAFDRSELGALPDLLSSFGVEASAIEELVRCAECATTADIRAVLHAELDDPSKLRQEVGKRDIQLVILQALFASYLWVCLPERDMHRFFDTNFNEASYCESFWDELQQRSPKLFHRNEALHFLVITEAWCKQFSSLDLLRDAILSHVRNSYKQLNNYGFLVVLLQSVQFSDRDISWELAADIVLFGEKHLEHPLDRAYFRPERISEKTLGYIPQINSNKARFDLVNEGFTYRDCFILTLQQSKQIEQLLILQKNHRDETVIPCPTCRSSKVEGNSYPSLGVKSWECRNPLCPDRSKYNRGKRYSFRGLAMQQALDDERNDIAPDFVRRWRRDVVEVPSHDQVLEMVIRHYSMWGDKIRCFGELTNQQTELLGRVLHWEPLWIRGEGNAANWFNNAAFFNRYGVVLSEDVPCVQWKNIGDNRLKIFCGDSRHVLRTFEEASIDGAVTSPPYYNAREYSQWQNIYCYLQDMFEINVQVFRVLKPGSLYFYNIFDYFDNENITALSAMGQKRITLSAYTIDLFRRIGFVCIGNIVWDKGDIEGKRGFNAGNFSPFYQSPFNCWEHVLVFRKPGGKNCDFWESRVLRAKPVLKMVKGKNRHGHTAPFPETIPLLCIETLPRNSVILDPFGGSLTTGRVAAATGQRAICIEQSLEYCELGLSLYERSTDESYLQQELAL